MSWFSDFFRNLFGHKPAPTPPAPQPEVTATLAQGLVDAHHRAIDALGKSAPAPTPTPTTDDQYPGTNNWGDYRDVMKGESPDAYWKRTGLAGYGKTTAQLLAERDAAAAQTEQGQLLRDEHFHGPVPVASLTVEEKAFLTYVTANYRFDPSKVTTQNDAWFAILNGSLAEINLAINQGDALAGHGGYDPNHYPTIGRMRGYVDQVANGMLRPVVTH